MVIIAAAAGDKLFHHWLGRVTFHSLAALPALQPDAVLSNFAIDLHSSMLVAIVIFAYLIGSIPTGYLLGRRAGVYIR